MGHAFRTRCGSRKLDMRGPADWIPRSRTLDAEWVSDFVHRRLGPRAIAVWLVRRLLSRSDRVWSDVDRGSAALCQFEMTQLQRHSVEIALCRIKL
jgi:hypothetical protein